MSTFYQLDSTRVSHKEYWWGARSPLVVLPWLLKWMRVRIPSSTDDPPVDSILPFQADTLPPEILERFEPLRAELAALGFSHPVYHVLRDSLTTTTLYWATFLHADGHHVARIHNRVWLQAKNNSRGLFPLFITGFDDGTFLVSSSGKPDMDAPPEVVMNRRQGLSAAALWESHLASLTSTAGRAPARVDTREALVEISERLHRRLCEFHVERGVFRPCSQELVADTRAFESRVAEVQASGLENAEVMAELERLQTVRPGWGNGLWILVISVIAFLAGGAADRSWKFTLLLIPILFFHEAGHWVAMKLCNYRNLRMFFIPFFGAAVTGQNWNVPGWKKVLVSLAGPVPGIVVGVILAGVAIATQRHSLETLALTLLLLNGFNLLPVLPLDGGHVLHATLFCRNRWLDTAFRVVAVAALLALSMGAGGLSFFRYLAIMLAVGVPVAFKLGRVTDQLRRVTLPEPEGGGDLIPVATAQAIIAAVQSEFRGTRNHKILAHHSLAVFETLNAKPPGALATLALLGVHLGSLLLVVVFGFLISVSRNAGLGLSGRAMVSPGHSYACESLRRVPAAPAPSTALERNTIVATFQNRTGAEKSFASLSPGLDSGARALLFGDSVLLSLPAADDAARERWFNELQGGATNVFVVLTNSGTSLALLAIAPNAVEATNLVEELHGYLSLSRSLLAPWAPQASLPGAVSLKARLAWSRMDNGLGFSWDDSRLKDLEKQSIAARRRGALPEVERLSAVQRDRIRELQVLAHEQAKTNRLMNADPMLIDLHRQLMLLDYTNRVERSTLMKEVARRLGAIPRTEDGTRPDPSAMSQGVYSGLVTARGASVEIRWIQFEDPVVGIPAFAEWLCSRGCRDLRYGFNGHLTAPGPDDDE